MRFAGGSKVLLHSEVNFQAVSPNPQPGARGEDWWLAHLGHAENADIELAAGALRAGRDRKLHVGAD